MNTQSDLTWLPESGVQLRKAGVQFDAIRVDGEEGRDVADRLARMTGGDPGPIVETATGRRGVYFLVPVGSTSHRAWPENVTRFTAAPGHVSYVPVPALDGLTWPLSWRYRPTTPDRLVHTRLLCTALHSQE
ncbi:hypothetical protein [Streptomyces viridochromogenes]|uniref:DNA primase/polymerase bifunctional N-terminal domain-containing protein n=1 Tax=Streptomyces viridochromogenes Tue57 TaxID=1160705 RepID=L8PBW1_STRVR|nr:hypothetical protein [Streptomyces viridochromogenes]ELS55061.1 hypothetical protein STVIR_3963 [Streptomyces viridochromogenes Tue57]